MKNSSSSSSSSSSLSSTLSNTHATEVEKKKLKKEQFQRNPLKDVNRSSSSNSSDQSSGSNKVSTSISVEVPKGCLRFFLSHSSSTKPRVNSNSNRHVKTPSRTIPKSISASKLLSKSRNTLSKENRSKFTVPRTPISSKPKRNTPCLRQLQSGKKPSSRNVSQSKSSVSQVDCDANLTPVTKLATGSGLDCGGVTKDNKGENRSTESSSKSKTPPVQVSVSPEIQCGSSIVSATTPACYAAGYVVSGVSDKRKCRPRGILTVGDNNLKFGLPYSEDEDDGKENDFIDSIVSEVPLPAEASMHWVLSPCDEKEENGKISSPSLLSNCEDICNISPDRTIDFDNNGRGRRKILLSLDELSEFRGSVGHFYGNERPSGEAASSKEVKGESLCTYNVDGKNSPFSTDTIGSDNVIQTPDSDNVPDRQAEVSWFDAEVMRQIDSEINSVAMNLERASLSSKSQASLWNPSCSSFQFDCLETPSAAVDLSQLQKGFGDLDSWFSNASRDYASQSEMRVSWRDGLVSRMFEMDESDCCRCLSDDEEDITGWNNDKTKPDQNPGFNVDSNDQLKNAPVSAEATEKEPVSKGYGIEGLPPIPPLSCAESISTDGGNLIRSEDSDWSICYKNHLLKE